MTALHSERKKVLLVRCSLSLDAVVSWLVAGPGCDGLNVVSPGDRLWVLWFECGVFPGDRSWVLYFKCGVTPGDRPWA